MYYHWYLAETYHSFFSIIDQSDKYILLILFTVITLKDCLCHIYVCYDKQSHVQ